jgi:hypothetical protein
MKCKMKSAAIDAYQFFQNQQPWPRGVREITRLGPDGEHITYVISTPGGPRTVRNGDWVLIGPTGEMTSYTDKQFHELYEIVE